MRGKPVDIVDREIPAGDCLSEGREVDVPRVRLFGQCGSQPVGVEKRRVPPHAGQVPEHRGRCAVFPRHCKRGVGCAARLPVHQRTRVDSARRAQQNRVCPLVAAQSRVRENGHVACLVQDDLLARLPGAQFQAPAVRPCEQAAQVRKSVTPGRRQLRKQYREPGLRTERAGSEKHTEWQCEETAMHS